MTDEDDFIRSLQAQPDAATKLVYADWLEECGDALRAGYLRCWAGITGRPHSWLVPPALYPEVERLSRAWLNLVHGHVPLWDSTTTLALGRLEGMLAAYASLNMHAADISHRYEATLARPAGTIAEVATRHYGAVCAPVTLEPLADWEAGLRAVLARWLFESLGTLRNGPIALVVLDQRRREYYLDEVTDRIRDVLRPEAGWQVRIAPNGALGVEWADLALTAADRVLFLHFSYSD